MIIKESGPAIVAIIFFEEALYGADIIKKLEKV